MKNDEWRTKLLENNWMQIEGDWISVASNCTMGLFVGMDPVPRVALKWPMCAAAPCKAYSTQKAV